MRSCHSIDKVWPDWVESVLAGSIFVVAVVALPFTAKKIQPVAATKSNTPIRVASSSMTWPPTARHNPAANMSADEGVSAKGPLPENQRTGTTGARIGVMVGAAVGVATSNKLGCTVMGGTVVTGLIGVALLFGRKKEATPSVRPINPKTMATMAAPLEPALMAMTRSIRMPSSTPMASAIRAMLRPREDVGGLVGAFIGVKRERFEIRDSRPAINH